MINVKPPEHIKYVLERLEENGYAAYLVGGCVRDAIIGRPVHDWDVTSSATPGDIGGIFEKTVFTGEKYGTVTVILPECSVEVTTFRTESDYSDGRRPENVMFTQHIEEDLSRRDFTMNAIAVSLSGSMTDPFGGIKDINDRVVRCVGEPGARFAEDALRMFRAFRFSAELGFDIRQGELNSIYANARKARLISAERIRVELEKTMLSRKPGLVAEMIKAGLLEKYMQTPGNHPNIPESFTALPAEAQLRWCAFSAILIKEGLIEAAGSFLRKMRLDAKTIKATSTALSINSFPDGSTGIKKLLAKHGKDAVRCTAAVQDMMHGGSTLKRTDETIKSGECFTLKDLAISGSDLISAGLPPGSELGKTLTAMLDHVIDHPEDNNRKTLLMLVGTTIQGVSEKMVF